MLRTNEDGSWILGNVLNYDRRTQVYEVQDEDDNSRVVQLAFSDVRRLDDTSGSIDFFRNLIILVTCFDFSQQVIYEKEIMFWLCFQIQLLFTEQLSLRILRRPRMEMAHGK